MMRTPLLITIIINTRMAHPEMRKSLCMIHAIQRSILVTSPPGSRSQIVSVHAACKGMGLMGMRLTDKNATLPPLI
jgi:hypothetical protein